MRISNNYHEIFLKSIFVGCIFIFQGFPTGTWSLKQWEEQGEHSTKCLFVKWELQWGEYLCTGGIASGEDQDRESIMVSGIIITDYSSSIES